MSPINKKALAPSTDRCLAILELLSQHPDGMTLSEIHRILDISKNMVFRILGDLSTRGYAYRDDSKTYFLGRKILELAAPRVGHRNLVDEAAAEIRDLRDRCGESVGLLIPSGGEAVLIYFQPSAQPIRTIYDVGIRIPLYSNAPGKVFLAFGDEAERQRRMKLQSFKRFNDRTITIAKKLEEQLQTAREEGYAIDCAEEVDGSYCVAAPVFDAEGRLIAAIVVTGPSERISVDRFPEYGRQVAQTAARITARLAR
ncbi:MAG TPA: IclR family transcriptional regulator [Planctomycetota bacterium]|jgi:IclR family acetate operon transcriptional repressor